MSASTSTSTSALPTLRQALCQLSSPSSLPTLFAKLFANFPAQCALGPQPGTCPAQCAPLDLNRDLPSSVCTAAPQPGTFPAQCAPLDLNQGPSAQCAPLDLNLGPAQPSVHRWTSTWDLSSSVCTAGPQPGTFPAQCALLDLNGQIECQKICQIECQMECQKICQIRLPEDMPDRMSDGMPEDMPDKMP